MVSALRIVDDSILDRVEIATPCDQSWDSMRGDDRVRYCDRCRLNVYDISAMERHEAVELLGAHEGRVCLRLFRRSDGTIITRDCAEQLRATRRRGVAAFGCMLALSVIPFLPMVCGEPAVHPDTVPQIEEVQPVKPVQPVQPVKVVEPPMPKMGGASLPVMEQGQRLEVIGK